MNLKNGNYARFVEHVQSIAKAAGRNPDAVAICAVSKTYHWKRVSFAYEEGCRVFGENKVHELLEKQQEAPPDVCWHLIGTLQSNKVNKIIGKTTLIHSVDSVKLAKKIADSSYRLGKKTAILLQVNTSGELSKHGLSIPEWKEQISEIVELEGIEIKGLMTMAPNTQDVTLQRGCFQALRECKDELNSLYKEALHLSELSMGMSNDYPIAIEEGSTIIRVGSALFGKRIRR